MQSNRSLVSPTSHPTLQKALEEKLQKRQLAGHHLGQLEALALRLGLMQGSLNPRFQDPQLLVFVADHGLAVDGIAAPDGQQTQHLVQHMLSGRLPLSVFAKAQQVELAVIDCGVSENLQAHEQLLMRKIAHGTRNARVTSAMSVEQAHAAMRAGMELGNKLRGNATLLAGVGVGSHESASMVLSRLTDCPIRDLLSSGPEMTKESLSHTMKIVRGAQNRHRAVADPVEVLAAYGGFEVAVMVGVMLMAAGRRQLLVIDGIAACAALMIASRIAPPVTDYCVFARSHSHKGLDTAMALFRGSALLDIGIEHIDGTGATLTWPLVRSAAALLSSASDGGADAESSEPVAFVNLENAFDDTFNDAHLDFGGERPLY